MEESGFCEDLLQKLKESRSAKLDALTKKRNKIAQLMGNYGNLELVQAKMANDFLKLRAELNELIVGAESFNIGFGELSLNIRSLRNF